jgi:hypothetical protein
MTALTTRRRFATGMATIRSPSSGEVWFRGSVLPYRPASLALCFAISLANSRICRAAFRASSGSLVRLIVSASSRMVRNDPCWFSMLLVILLGGFIVYRFAIFVHVFFKSPRKFLDSVSTILCRIGPCG